MNETKKLNIISKRFIPDHPDFSQSPYTYTSLSIEVDLSEPTIEFRYRREKDEILNRHVTHSYIYAGLSEQQLIELMKFFTTPKPESGSETSTFTLQLARVLCRHRRDNKDSTEVNPSHLLFEAHSDRIIIETFGGENQVLSYCEVEQGSTPQDRNNLESVQDFSTRLVELLEEDEDSNRDESKQDSVEFPRIPLEKVIHLCRRFPYVARQLEERYDSRDTIKIGDEYDTQDLLEGLLRIYFDDVRPEEGTPSHAGSSSFIDFLIKEYNIAIEVKKTRRNLTEKRLGEELSIDKERYQSHGGCDTLVCFVYDPESRLTNPAELRDLEESGEFTVRVIVS